MKNFTGYIKDPRNEYQKTKDYHHKYFFATTPVVWKEKNELDWKEYAIRNQDGSGSCVAQAAAKCFEVNDGEVTSASPLYRFRSSFPNPGMYLQEVGSNAKGIGTVAENKCQSEMLDDAGMNATVLPNAQKKVAGYLWVDHKNIDEIAGIIESQRSSGKNTGVLLAFKSTYAEWGDVPVANMWNIFPWQFWQHCVCAVDYTLYQGKKALIIDESWGDATDLGNGGQRIITEDYLKARCLEAMYFTFAPITTMYKYFSAGEVAKWKLKAEVWQMLDKAREMAGTPFVLTSGLRTVAENIMVGGKPNSAHLRGLAADILCTDPAKRTLILRGVLNCGIPVWTEIAHGHIHVDLDSSIHRLGDTEVSDDD